jgi:hypothetical protein
MSKDLTMHEAIADGLTAMVNAADGLDQRSFARLLHEVACKLLVEGVKRPPQISSSSPYPDNTQVGVLPSRIAPLQAARSLSGVTQNCESRSGLV